MHEVEICEGVISSAQRKMIQKLKLNTSYEEYRWTLSVKLQKTKRKQWKGSKPQTHLDAF